MNTLPLLQIDEATVLRGGRPILDKLSLTVNEGEHTAIVGPNGSGKSTLIKLITRQHYPLAREGKRPPVTIFGQDTWNVFELRALMGIVSADLHYDFVSDSSLRGFEAVVSGFFSSQGLFRNHLVTPDMEARAREALAQVGGNPLAEKPLEQMSTGEARRILIARALVSNPRALLLDEPTTGLDLVSRRHFLETLRKVANDNKTILLVTHHVEEIFPEIRRIILLKDGKLFLDGAKQDILTTQNLSALFDEPIEVQPIGDYYAANVSP